MHPKEVNRINIIEEKFNFVFGGYIFLTAKGDCFCESSATSQIVQDMLSFNEITSRKNETIKQASKLYSDKKERDKNGLFPAEGIKLIEEALMSGLTIKSVFFTKSILENNSSLLEKLSEASLYLVTDEVYDKITDESAPQGVLAFIKKPEPVIPDDNAVAQGGFVILEDIQNPLNIGAILRCCYSLGFEKIVFSSKCADIYSPKCVRAAMGSLFKITPCFADSVCDVSSRLVKNGNRVFCTSLSEKSVKLGNFDFLGTDSFAIGNEGHGVSDALMESCSHSLYIPMNEGAESLNAATAAAIVMWEMKKNVLIK